jgi:quinoprotein glucose dehydrogenase
MARLQRLLLIGVLAAAAAPLSGQQSPQTGKPSIDNGEWPDYSGDLRGWRYSPLDQINASNFNQLQVAWRFKTDNLGPRPEYKLEGTPVMVRGTLYTTGGTRRSVISLDGRTGELNWAHSLREGQRAAVSPRQLSGRGVSYWTDGKGDERVVYVTTGYQLVELDAKTGAMIQSFGNKGVVDLKVGVVKGVNQQIDLTTGEIGIHSTPAVVGDIVIVGSSMREGATVSTHNNTKGLVRAFDVRTGKQLWRFDTIPAPGEFGHDTWLNDSWAINGNVGVWTQISVDEPLGLVYLPVETPTSDHYGGHRPGNNLFAESLVCVDLKTGKRKWHFQFVHHPLWNLDMSSAPLLADINANGRAIRAVAVPSKQNFMYVFDRVTGEPVWPIEERPVPAGDVPGEWYSKTQPFPTKPPAYARNFVNIPDDIIDFTPELRKQALSQLSRYQPGPLFNPPVLGNADGLLGSLSIGNLGGGTNWPGGGYDPETHVAYAPASNAGINSHSLVTPPAGFSDIRYVRGVAGQPFVEVFGPGDCCAADSPRAMAQAAGAAKQAVASQAKPAPPAAAPSPAARASALPPGGLTVEGLPIMKPPYGVLAAIHLDRGELLWQVPHGDTPDGVKNHPLLKGLNIPKTGQNGAVGLLVTRTLVIMGDPQATTTPRGRGAMLRAYNKMTGEQVGAVVIPAPQSGSPMTYSIDGRQYIVVAVSGGAYSGEYIAFRLPN